MFFSPEARALRNDPDIGPAQEHALLDHLFKGYKNLVPNGKGQFSLAVDDAVKMSPAELNQFQIDEVNNVLKNTDFAGEFKTLQPEDREYIKDLIKKHITQGSITSVGGAGAEGRFYPKDFSDASLAGTKIPAIYAPGQKEERGVKLLLDVAEAVDPDTGAGLFALPIDAMHKQPAAVRPDLVAAVDNIKYGPQSLNQSDGRRVGDDFVNSRKSRLTRLQDERFFLENNVSNKQRGGYDENTRNDMQFLKAYAKASAEIEALTGIPINNLRELIN